MILTCEHGLVMSLTFAPSSSTLTATSLLAVEVCVYVHVCVGVVCVQALP